MTSDRILPGDIYEDCDFHPVLCTESSVEDDVVCGISLIDGTMPRSCSFAHCDVQRLSINEAIQLRDVWDALMSAEVRSAYESYKAEIIVCISAKVFVAILEVIEQHPSITVRSPKFTDKLTPLRGAIKINISVPTYAIIAYVLLRSYREGLIRFAGPQMFLTEEGEKALNELRDFSSTEL